jgi:membrane protease YdiL (CAAX protease family)
MDGKAYPSIKNAILLCLLAVALQIGSGLIIGLVIGFVFAMKNMPNISEASTISDITAVSDMTNMTAVTGIATGLINLVALGIVILIGFKKTKRGLNEVFKLNKVSPALWAAATLFMVGSIIVISELDNLLNHVLPMPEMLRNMFYGLAAGQPFVFAIIVMGIIPGIMEELLFRGLILDGFQRNYSQRKAILLSALLFGLIHLNPWQFYSAFIIGVISAFICLKTNSLLLSIYIHFFNNTLYTIAVKYRELVPIQGFNSNFAAPVEFQPLWFDAIGLAILIAGILALKKGLKKAAPATSPEYAGG